MLNYRFEELKQRQENTRILRKALNSNKIDKKLREKLDNFCERHSLEFELVKYKLLIDDLFVLYFIKDPGKQGIHQKLASEFLVKLPRVRNFKVLSPSGKNSLYVVNGIVLNEKLKKNTTVSVKSIDFEWEYISNTGEIIQCYASHKYTHGEGGGQDNQCKDIISFLEHSQKHRQNSFFYAICDGMHYQQPFEGYLSRMNYLNENHKGSRCYALTIDDIDNHMATNL